jgi:hypothetical protein
MSEQTQEVELQVVNEWDNVIIQIAKGEGENSGSGAVRMMKQDIDAMMELHGVDRGYILDMLLQALETTQKENFLKNENQPSEQGN